MAEPVELHVTQNFDESGWDVWFDHPLGGRNVLNEESFATQAETLVFAQEQMDSADVGDQE
jgi:hypothetical protein